MLPSELLSIQQWFASIITRPIDSDSRMMSLSPNGRAMAEEAQEFIKPSHSLSADQRIEIYNQQYWWRLLSILHDHFPTVTRLFGYTDFNRIIAIPFLTAFPPHHWSLAKLGDVLHQWIENEYSERDKALVQSAVELDWAFQELYLAPHPIPLEASLELLSKPLILQRHVKLFALPCDLFSYRKEFLEKEVEFWTDSDFPRLAKERKYFFILWRNARNHVVYKEIEEAQWMLLHLISHGRTIEEASEFLENQGGSLFEEALTSFQEWIQEWIKEDYLQEKNDELD